MKLYYCIGQGQPLLNSVMFNDIPSMINLTLVFPSIANHYCWIKKKTISQKRKEQCRWPLQTLLGCWNLCSWCQDWASSRRMKARKREHPGVLWMLINHIFVWMIFANVEHSNQLWESRAMIKRIVAVTIVSYFLCIGLSSIVYFFLKMSVCNLRQIWFRDF